MDKIRKFVERLNRKQAQWIEKALLDIVSLNIEKYDVEKMQGFKHLYRLRMGKIRIIFRKHKEYGLPIDINYRGKIYKKYQ